MNHQLVLALDVGGSSVKSALVEDGQRIVGSVCVDVIQSGASATEILNGFAAILSTYLEKTSGVSRIAFAFPGPFDYEQGISLMHNQAKYEALYGINIATKLREILGAPTLEMRFRNDAEAAILGEALHGAGVPYARLLGLTLGTGLGSAFIANGNLITQGENFPPHGWLYSCMFESQCADDVFSTRGLLTRLRQRGIQTVDISSAMHTTDHNALKDVFTSFGADLGVFLEPFVSAFHADAVLVTGGIAETWERFAPSMIRVLQVPVLRGILGNRAALLGAAALYF
ncbi:MAG TPA: ROK family protein [Anaerolineales bacterium]|nr:ROK family protein [Anaerolineales bacterium]